MKALFANILACCARWYLRKTKPYIIWVTWSVGKTTCRLIITEMLRHQLPWLRIRTSEKNFNSEIGLCLAILDISTYRPTFRMTICTIFYALWRVLWIWSRPDVLVLEYGIDHPRDMDELLAIARPDISILTAVDRVHAVYFPSADHIFTEKVKLIDAARDVAFYASSLEEYVHNRDSYIDRDLLSFALHEDENTTDIWFNAYMYRRIDEHMGSEFIVCEGEDRMTKIRTNLIWQEHAGYLSLAYEIWQIVSMRKNVDFVSLSDTLLSIDLQPGRMQRFLWRRWSLLLDSSYNASPQSMRMMIELITDIRQKLFPERQLVWCLGEMRELGNLSQEAHEELASRCLHFDHLFLIGHDMQEYLLPALQEKWYPLHRVSRYADSSILGAELDVYLWQQKELALVLFKGSQNTIFLEEAVKQVLRSPEDEKNLCRQEWRWLKKKKL